MLRATYKTLCLISILALCVLAKSAWAESPYKVSLETDPSTFAFNGYAAHARLESDDSPWSLGVGTYSLKFPGMMRDLAMGQSTNANSLKLQNGYGIFIDRHFSAEKGAGLFIGAQLAHHQYQLTDSNIPNASTSYQAWLFMPRMGYQIKIGTSGLYALPWLGIGYVSPNTKSAILGSNAYPTKHWLPFGTVHIGYTF